MKRLYFRLIWLLIILTGWLLACGHSSGTDSSTTLEPTFSSIQDNILTPKCVNQGCHPGNLAPMSLREGESYNALVNAQSAYGIPRVDPSNADNSALYLKVIGTSLGARMPLNRSPLSTTETDAIRDWINNGALNN